MNDAHEHVEDYSLVDQLRYGPADLAALEEKDRQRRAAEQQIAQEAARHPTVEAMLAIEQAVTGINTVLAERKQVHGDFTDDATLAQGLKDLMQNSNNWRAMTPVMREALEHIQTKVARICSGDFNHRDSWVDLQGYARLVEERL